MHLSTEPSFLAKQPRPAAHVLQQRPPALHDHPLSIAQQQRGTRFVSDERIGKPILASPGSVKG